MAVVEQAGYRVPAPPEAATFRFRPGFRRPSWRRASWAFPIVAVLIGLSVNVVSRNASITCKRGPNDALVCHVRETELGFRRWQREVRIDEPKRALTTLDSDRGTWTVSVLGARGQTPLTRIGTGNRGDATFVSSQLDHLIAGKVRQTEVGYTYTGLRELAAMIGSLLFLACAFIAQELSRRGSVVIEPATGRVRLLKTRTRKREQVLELDRIRGVAIERQGLAARICIELADGKSEPLTDAFHWNLRRQRAISHDLAAALQASGPSVVTAEPRTSEEPSLVRHVLANAALVALCAGLGALAGGPHFVQASENVGWLLQLVWTIPATVLVLGLFAGIYFLIATRVASPSVALTIWAVLVTPLSGWGLVRLANVGFDDSPGVSHDSRLIRRVRRSKGNDKLEIASWIDPSSTITLQSFWVPYDKQTPGAPLRVVTRRGWLGIEWVASTEVLPP
jgi:hypothetical protein